MSDFTEKEYFAECRACAKAAIEQAKEYSEDIEDVLQEMIDGHEYIIYTHKARLVIAWSENPDAYEDEMGERAPTDEARAFMAMRADVQRYVAAYQRNPPDDEDEDESEGQS